MLGASVVQGMCSNGGGNVVREVVTLGASVVQGMCSNGEEEMLLEKLSP